MRQVGLCALLLAACGSTSSSSGSGSTTSGAAPARRACPHEASEPVPSSCIRASARGKLLKDDHAGGVRIWQACERDLIVDGAFVLERVGNGRDTSDQLAALATQHAKDLWKLGASQSAFGGCGGAPGDAPDGPEHDAGCIELGFTAHNQDVPGTADDLMRVFATAEDLCIPFRIDTGVGVMENVGR